MRTLKKTQVVSKFLFELFPDKNMAALQKMIKVQPKSTLTNENYKTATLGEDFKDIFDTYFGTIISNQHIMGNPPSKKEDVIKIFNGIKEQIKTAIDDADALAKLEQTINTLLQKSGSTPAPSVAGLSASEISSNIQFSKDKITSAIQAVDKLLAQLAAQSSALNTELNSGEDAVNVKILPDAIKLPNVSDLSSLDQKFAKFADRINEKEALKKV